MANRGIPTMYQSVRFRSRLEAKWAAFFTRCGWPWSYEPVDLPGWIPDFAIGWQPTFVEVKPFFRAEDFDPVLTQLTASGHRAPVVLLGATPRFNSVDCFYEGLAIGWLAEWVEPAQMLWCGRPVYPDGGWIVYDLHIGTTEGNDRLGLCPMESAWVNVIWRAPDGLSHPNKYARVRAGDTDYDTLWRYWAEAGNATQWMAKQAVGA